MIQTGVRVSELVGLRICDVHLGTGAHIRVTGKGRKKRSTTLTRETVQVLHCPSLKTKRVTPHTLRHTNAMLLRAKEVDIATIALWPGQIPTLRHAPRIPRQAMTMLSDTDANFTPSR